MAPLTPSKGGPTKDDDDDDDHDEITDEMVGGGLAGLLIKLQRNGQAIYACSLYSFCSVSMVLVNKSLASRCVVPPSDQCYILLLEIRSILPCEGICWR